jgi:hypothetical protein
MLRFHNIDNTVIAELNQDDFIISSASDVLEFFGELISENCSRIIIRETNFHPDFFRLQTGITGDILQKFSNYRFRLAITGDFSKYESKSFQDFIRESNKGNLIFFVDNIDTALLKLTNKNQE